MRATFIVSSVAVLALGIGDALARPDTRAMTCAQVQSIISQNGAAVLATGPNTYDRYVAAGGARCKVGQITRRASVPSKDGKCPVYRCVEFDLSPG